MAINAPANQICRLCRFSRPRRARSDVVLCQLAEALRTLGYAEHNVWLSIGLTYQYPGLTNASCLSGEEVRHGA